MHYLLEEGLQLLSSSELGKGHFYLTWLLISKSDSIILISWKNYKYF